MGGPTTNFGGIVSEAMDIGPPIGGDLSFDNIAADPAMGPPPISQQQQQQDGQHPQMAAWYDTDL